MKKGDFTSQTTRGRGLKFTKKFKKPGHVQVHLHDPPDAMKMTVKVKK